MRLPGAWKATCLFNLGMLSDQYIFTRSLDRDLVGEGILRPSLMIEDLWVEGVGHLVLSEFESHFPPVGNFGAREVLLLVLISLQLRRYIHRRFSLACWKHS